MTPVALLLGPPGAGKSTQARRLAARLGWTAIDFGQLVRAAVAADTALGREAVAHRERRGPGPRQVGAWLPDALCRALLAERLAAGDPGPGLVLEGYPRTTAQAGFLEDGRWRLVRALALEVDDEERRRRLALRVVDRTTGEVQRRDRAGDDGAWAPRPEDAPASLAARLVDWERDTVLLLELYRSRGVLSVVDGAGEEDEVTTRLALALAEGGA